MSRSEWIEAQVEALVDEYDRGETATEPLGPMPELNWWAREMIRRAVLIGLVEAAPRCRCGQRLSVLGRSQLECPDLSLDEEGHDTLDVPRPDGLRTPSPSYARCECEADCYYVKLTKERCWGKVSLQQRGVAPDAHHRSHTHACVGHAGCTEAPRYEPALYRPEEPCTP